MLQGNSTMQMPDNREKIAKTVAITVLLSTLSVTIFALIIIVTDNSNKEKWNSVKDVLAIVFPLWGTWIGTVLAYYFSKDNFDAANRSVKDLVSIVTGDQKLQSIKVSDKDVMIGLKDIKPFVYTTPADMATKKISEFIEFMKSKNVSRLPFITSEGSVQYCIHRSIFDKYLSERALETPAVNLPALTFNDLLNTNINEIQSYVKASIQFAKEDATLYDVKLLMESNKYCEDVFITKSGKKEEPVIGWITNVIILDKSKA